MTWAKLDGKFHSHPKVLEIGYAATGLFALSLSYAAGHLTDGRLPLEWVKTHPKRLVGQLFDAGLWATDEHGWYIADYLDYNQSREQIRRRRKNVTQRVTRYRGKRNAVSNALVTGPIDKDKDKDALTRKSALVQSVNFDIDLPREVSEYARELRDATDKTTEALLDLRRRLPEAAFHSAMEALNERRQRKPPLTSETRYFLGTLRTMVRERRYGA